MSVRVPKELHAAFQEAARFIDVKGDRLSLTRVVEIAMQDAIDEVERIYGVDCYQADIELAPDISDDEQQGLFKE